MSLESYLSSLFYGLIGVVTLWIILDLFLSLMRKVNIKLSSYNVGELKVTHTYEIRYEVSVKRKEIGPVREYLLKMLGVTVLKPLVKYEEFNFKEGRK